MVRGRHVPFDSVTINAFYGIPEMETDDYSVMRSEIDISQLTDTLCIPNATWEMSRSGEYMKMSSKLLKPYARVWFHFLTRSLMPGTHITYVTKEMMILFYCLMEGFSIDVGVVISSNIVWAANSSLAGLFYPYLVTSLCAMRMVPMEPREILMQPKTALTPRLIQQLLTERQMQAGSSSSAPAPTPQQPSSSAPAPTPQQPSSSAPAAAPQQPASQPRRAAHPRSDSQRLEHLERRSDYFTYFNVAMAQAFQQLTRDLHVSVPQFPVPPDDSDEEEDI